MTTACIRSKISARESCALFSLDIPVGIRVDPDTPVTHHASPRPPKPPVPPPRAGSLTGNACSTRNDDYRFNLQQLQRASIDIRKLHAFARHIHNTQKDEVEDELMRLYEPLRTLHNRRMEARAEIMCALHDLKQVLDTMFS